MPLVLLPGLDGTEVFLRPLIAQLPASVRPVVIGYAGAGGYDDLLPKVRRTVSQLPECYVLGWSFGGPLALMLAAEEPDRVRGVILSSTFVRAPRPWLAPFGFALVSPVIWLYRGGRRLPASLFRPPTDPWRVAKAETWRRTPARVVAARIRASLRVDVRPLLSTCRQPVLCLAASRDIVVPRHNVDEIRCVRPSVDIVSVDGGHLAIYTNPESAAHAIMTFIAARER
jgi:pimeloyl-ACP methyl ester carboxylesterase